MSSTTALPEPEVVERAQRRRFSAAYKRRVVEEAELCTQPGQIGALLRREGLYSSILANWRRQFRQHGADGLAAKWTGRPRTPDEVLELRRLRAENERLTKKLAQAALIIDVQEKSIVARGTTPTPRRLVAPLIAEVTNLAAVTGVTAACAALTLPRASFYRHRALLAPHDPRPAAPDPSSGGRSHPRALAPEERQQVLDILHSPRFRDRAPAEVVATLLDEGSYLASERTMYRILAAAGETGERRNQLVHPAYAKPELLATGLNQLWSWDITKLKGPSKWTYFYLYVILDVYSRYVVGWLVALRESAVLAEQLIDETAAKHGIPPGQLTIHADRGASMTSKPVAFLLADLGITKSHSRPHVSNDNPFSESQFKTMKYWPGFPDRFDSFEVSRAYCRVFFEWYNTEHRHSGIGMLTPAMVHTGQAELVRTYRTTVLHAAYDAHPERFVHGKPAPPPVPDAVWINPPATTIPTPSSAKSEVDLH
ncbi:MAG: IS3 family transposase [Dehalococcoidia bacterium]